jgi:ribA/ribD-fused uncharacterized protein
MDKSARNWFSNMIEFEDPLVYEGIFYVTPEHFYQAMKSKSKLYRERVAACKTGMLAKRLGRKVNIREDWEDVKLMVMERAQRHRFQIGTKWRERLVETDGEIVEWNYWHDRIWGKCTCEKCKGNGRNLLGEMLMKIRDEIVLEDKTNLSS